MRVLSSVLMQCRFNGLSGFMIHESKAAEEVWKYTCAFRLTGMDFCFVFTAAKRPPF